MDPDFHHAGLPGLGQQAADHGPGDVQLPGDVALPLTLQIVTAGHIGQSFMLFSAHLHGAASLLMCFIGQQVTYNIKEGQLQRLIFQRQGSVQNKDLMI